jgi:CRISPR-associated endonuclease/helicase Cas3
LLEWLGALQCSVVLLSATLPVARRNALLQAWVEGATGKPGTQIQNADQGYPRVSVARASGAIESFALPVSERSRWLLGLRWIGRDALAADLLSALAGGGCAAVVCNTVSEAQETYSDLRRILDQQPEADRPELELLHSRFMLRDRQRIEKAVLERFGPSDSGRPTKAILVATQIVEQSLDLDFDLMVSELAPVDLLLQRSGRLHRHPRQSRPRQLADPGLWIIDPDCDEDGLPVFGRRSCGVYQPYILLRSWVALRPRTTIRIPEDVEELIEGTYGENAEAAESPLQSELRRMKSRMDADIANMEQEARNRFLPKPWAEVPLSNFTENPLEEDNPAVHQRLQAVTRLTDASVQIVRLCQMPDPQAAPSPKQVMELLLCSLSIADPRLVRALVEIETPVAWTKNALLRFHKPVVFDSSGRANVNGWVVELDPLLGFRTLGREEI